MSKSNLTVAFKDLRKHGYFARQNFMCCQSCGWAGVPDGKEDKVVFFHNQDNENRLNGEPFYLAWSGDGNLICDVLREHGIEVKWDGGNDTRICVVSNYE
jgi:hypothetical protein